MSEQYHPERAALERNSMSVLKTATKLTQRWVGDHPEIAILYRDSSLTQKEIARSIDPDVTTQYPRAAMAAIGNVLRKQLPAAERSAITYERNRITAANKFRKGLTDEEFSRQQSDAAKARKGKDWNWQAAVIARGRIPWGEFEKVFTARLAQDPAFQHSSGSYKGLPDYGKIHEAVNNIFHEGRTVRSAQSIQGFLRGRKST